MVEPYDQAQLLFDQTGIEHAISAWVAQTYDQTAGWRMEPPDGDLNLELLYDLLGLDLTEEIYIGSDL